LTVERYGKMKRSQTIVLVVMFALATCAAAFSSYKWLILNLQHSALARNLDDFATRSGSSQARADFRVGTRRYLEVVESKDTARKLRQQGEFEIIGHLVHPNLGPMRVEIERSYVKAYNDTMSSLYANPKDIDADYWSGHSYGETTQPADAPDTATPNASP
jgi:hypothetical protein